MTRPLMPNDVEPLVRAICGHDVEIMTFTDPNTATMTVTIYSDPPQDEETLEYVEERLQDDAPGGAKIEVKQGGTTDNLDDNEIPTMYGGDTDSFCTQRSPPSSAASGIQPGFTVKTEQCKGSMKFNVDVDRKELDEAVSEATKQKTEILKGLAKRWSEVTPNVDADQIAKELEQEDMNTISKGDRVYVEGVNGQKNYGTVLQVWNKVAGEYTIGNGETLAEYWERKGTSIQEGQSVYQIELEADGMGVYDYPESKVKKVPETTKVDGIGPKRAESLKEYGYHSIESLKNAETEELAAVPGMGNALAARIKGVLSDLDTDDEKSLGDLFEVPTEQTAECPVCGEDFSVTADRAVEDPVTGKLCCSLECVNNA